MSKCFIVEYTYTPDPDVNHICDDAFTDPMIARQYIRERAEDTLDNYASDDLTDFIMDVSWEAVDYNKDEVIIRNGGGKEVERWTITQLNLNTQGE